MQASHTALGGVGWGTRGRLVDAAWTVALAALAVRATGATPSASEDSGLSSFGFVPMTPDLALLSRLRGVLRDEPVTETELRGLMEQTDGLVRALGAHIAGSEHRLTELSDDPDSSLKEIAAELHRVERLRPRLEEARSLHRDLELRARELRTAWLLRQAERSHDRNLV